MPHPGGDKSKFSFLQNWFKITLCDSLLVALPYWLPFLYFPASLPYSFTSFFLGPVCNKSFSHESSSQSLILQIYTKICLVVKKHFNFIGYSVVVQHDIVIVTRVLEVGDNKKNKALSAFRECRPTDSSGGKQTHGWISSIYQNWNSRVLGKPQIPERGNRPSLLLKCGGGLVNLDMQSEQNILSQAMDQNMKMRNREKKSTRFGVHVVSSSNWKGPGDEAEKNGKVLKHK